jgi:hypothetical protein
MFSVAKKFDQNICLFFIKGDYAIIDSLVFLENASSFTQITIEEIET